MLIQENVELAPLTTFRIGGAARFFAEVASENDLRDAVRFGRERGLPIFILGGGSNLLVSDHGFGGIVIAIRMLGIEREGELVIARAGEDWDRFCAWCVSENLAGVECLSGIPGLVGGTPVQNVGAYGQEVSETIEAVRAFDLERDDFVELSNADCRFGYRASIFNTVSRDRFVVTAVSYRLKSGGEPKIAYKDLQAIFGERRPTLAETRDAVRGIRAEKGMLVRQGGADSQSAGSFFKNPVVPESVYESIRDRVGNVPSFPAGNLFRKIPAAWLIEQSGFAKGYQIGNAGLSTLHTLALTNRGGARASEIIELRNLIRKGVAGKFGIELEMEPIMLGFDQDSR